LNFFGHAVVAGWKDERPGNLLGSMLPDFEGMLGIRLLEVRDPEMQRGIELHHRTDDVFHRTPSFLAFCAYALDDLTLRGVRRGTARAIGHIGSELFLDGWLARERTHVDKYLSALAVEVDDALRWEDEGHAFSALHRRLASWGAPRDYAEPSFVLARLFDALRRRPALELLEEHSSSVAAFLPSLRERVESGAAELLLELQDGLGFDH
jgi:hypothetical protein